MAGLRKLERKRPSTAAFGNWGITSQVNWLSSDSYVLLNGFALLDVYGETDTWFESTVPIIVNGSGGRHLHAVVTTSCDVYQE